MPTLQDVTGNESGAVQYDDGGIWIGNWSGINGIPRLLEPIGVIGLDEEMDGESCEVPPDVMTAMIEHEASDDGGGERVSEAGDFRAVRCGNVIVVTSTQWC